MNAITPFDFEGRAVRVVEDAAGLPWFVALDVCECLCISKPRDAVARLDEDERGPVVVDTLGGAQQVSAVNEPGLYSLTLTSRKPEAKRFKRWITHDVLPALRRTGSYSLPGAESADRLPPMPLAPQHRADVLVSASRSFAALVRAGRTLRMSQARAIVAANAATLRATGVDLVQELGAEDLAAETSGMGMLAGVDEDFPGAGALVDWLQGRDELTMADALQVLGVPASDRGMQTRVGYLLRRLGWRLMESRRGGVKLRVYRRTRAVETLCA